MPLNKAVRGLSDTLGLFRGGTVPLEFTGAVNPSLDVDQYLNEWRSDFQSGVADQLGLTLEDGFLYKVHAIAGNVVNAGGDQSLEVYPYIATQGNFLGFQPGLSFTAAGIFGVGLIFGTPLIIGTSMDVTAVGLNRAGKIGNPGMRVNTLYQRWAI